jgi:probable Rubsico expression protein CbbX
MYKISNNLIINSVKSIDIRNCYINTGIQNILNTLNEELIGLKNVKNKIHEISSVLVLDRIRHIQGLPILNSSLHMAFTGRSGIGKTSVAEKFALVLRNLGYLTKGHIINVTREDLVGQYVGHTAPKTREQLQAAKGGILFIDEAYNLYKPDNEKDYGSEVIELLLQVMENQRDDLIIIFSGIKHKLEKFFDSNPGVSSRIGNHIDFVDYNIEELMQITKFLLYNENRYCFTNEILEIFEFYLSQLIEFPSFANVRTIKVFLNQLFLYHSIRIEKNLKEKGSLNYKVLINLEKDDFKFFTKEDFINIIGNENIDLYSFNKKI